MSETASPDPTAPRANEAMQRTLTPEIRVLSESEGTVEYIASDESIDSYREIIAAKGWRFTRFAKNAPFVDSHDYWSIDKLLGYVTGFEIRGGKLIERVKWAKDVDENAMAKLGWKMTVAGFLKAVSVGFFPVRWVCAGGEGWGPAVTDLKLSADDAGKCRLIYLEQEQIELSACIIGANPNALAKAHKAGAVGDGDLAAAGMTDEDMSFLQLAGAACERTDLDPLMRVMIGREMGRIAARANKGPATRGAAPNTTNFNGTSAGSGSPTARQRDAAERAERRADQRQKFLRELSAVTGK